MQPLNPQVAQQMRERARAIRDRQAQGGFVRGWSLSGKQAIVEPGQSVTVRLAPRWDYADSVVVDPKTGQRAQNPAYKSDQPAYVVAYEHWWDSEGGRPVREFCPKSLDPESECAVCQSAAVLMNSGVKDDRDFGKRIQVREVFIFNAVVGDPRRLGQDGLVDIRPLSVPGTVFNAISDIMTGGDNAQFARGDITHPIEGYDIALRRPVPGGGDRWTVQVAAESNKLPGSTPVAAFKGWSARLTDLEEMLQKETKDGAGIFRAYYGRDPEPGEVRGTIAPAQDEPASAVSVHSAVQAAPSAAPPVAPDDEFMPPAPASQRGSAKPQATSPASAAGSPGRSRIAPRAPRR